MTRVRTTKVALAIGLVLMLLTAVACGDSGDKASTGTTDASSGGTSSDVTLTIYTDQHAEMIEGLTKAYTEQTGVKFNIQNDANVGQIEAEGSASKADLFLSEDPAPVAQLGAAGLLAPVDATTLDQVRPGLSSPDGLWVAYAARSRVVMYNPTLIEESELPATLDDLVTDEKYAGQFAWAPSGAFVATTQYLLDTRGEDETRTFLEAVKKNGVNEQKNGNVRDTVEQGKHAMGLSNHYYWWILANQQGGPDKLTSKLYNFPTEDVGNLILSSGAGIMKSSKNQEAAQAFLAWLTAPDGGQKIIASGPIDISGAQYPVAVGVSSDLVGSLDDVKSPNYDMDIFADNEQAENLLKEMGMSKG